MTIQRMKHTDFLKMQREQVLNEIEILKLRAAWLTSAIKEAEEEGATIDKTALPPGSCGDT